MKKTLATVIPLLVCMAHTTGLCFVSHSPQLLETKNWQLETDSRAPRGTVSSNAYDIAGHVIETWAWRANVPVSRAAFAYDANGNVTSFTDAAGVETAHTYDALNRVIETKVAQTFLSAYSHDPLGNLIATTNALGKVRQWEYDVMSRRTAAIRPSGATDHFSYDFLGNQTAYTNSEGNVYTMAYDALGRMVAATNALGEQVFRAWYDYNGNITNKIDGRGVSVHSTYDALDRLTAVFTNSTVNNARISAFTYDAVGNMLTASNAVAQETFTYDVMNRVTNAVTKVAAASLPPSVTTRWQRDLGGLVTNLVYATGKNVSYTYNEDGNLTSVKDWLGNQWTFTYDPAGRLTGMSSPKVAQTFLSAFSYDNAGRLSSWSVDGIAGRTITYDAANRRIRDDITAGAIPKPTLQRTAQNTFDAADKLISSSVRYGQGADSTDHITETFLYDGNGALTNWLGSPLWKGGGGNAAGGLSLTYDAMGQVSSLAANSYSYDALGNRIVMDNKLFIPNHSDSLKRPLMEYDSNGNVLRYYIWSPNKLLGFIDSSGILTVAHSDEIGSVIALTDLSGNVLYSANYGPHGEDWGSTGFNPTPFAWLGGYGVQYLETDTPLRLYLTRHRVYSATLNRFLSADPMGLAGGANLYAYGEGNPMAYIDPLGLCASGGGFWGGVGDYLRESGTFLLGELSAVYNAVEGLAKVVNATPYTPQGMINAFEMGYNSIQRAIHPLDTFNGVIGNISDTWNSGTFGKGQIFGDILVTAGLFAVPYAKTAPAAMSAPATTTTMLSDVTVISYGKTVGQGTVNVGSTVQAIQSGTASYRGVFQNTANLLPVNPTGYYREFLVPTPGVSGAGPQRIITGMGGELYYTPNHYQSFIPLNP